ncbi:MAG: hypothetical protein KBD01_15340, partial [Acidobacteria bacterium]|nr:hypothetical protein [Acidobacteriota bacterium]
MRRGAPFTLLVPLALVSIAARAAGPVPEGGFWYVHAGAPVRLAPSPRYAAALVSDELARQLPLRPPAGWVVDPRGQRQDLAARGLNLFRLPLAAPVKGLEPNTTRGSWTDGLAAGLEAEPVFECGNTLAVPLDEVLVAFAPGTTPLQARRAIRGQRGRLGIRQVRRLRGATFLVTIERAAAGRALESSRTLAALPRVLWAEPNFARIVLETPAEVPPLA